MARAPSNTAERALNVTLSVRVAKLMKLMRELRGSFWVVPLACVLCALVASQIAHAIDAHIADDYEAWYLFKGGPEGARQVLNVVATSMMTFTGLVFSVTVLVLQLASSQFSPRVLRTFLDDRASQVSLGVFVGTFAYALSTMRTVRGATDSIELRVPSLTIWVAVVLALTCVVAFVFYIHHVAQSIRAVVIVRAIGDQGRAALEDLYPESIGDVAEEEAGWRPEHPATLVVPSGRDLGVLVRVHEQRLERALCGADVVVELVPYVGDFVPTGGELFRLWGDVDAVDVPALMAAVDTGIEREARQDVAFAIRELVDIAERALSPGINDPTTAVQVIDQIHDLLRRLARRKFPPSLRKVADGRAFVYLPRPTWADYVALACDEIRQYGSSSVQVLRRLRAMLSELATVAPAFRRGVLNEQLALLDEAARRSFADEWDRRHAGRPSPQGHGPLASARAEPSSQPS